MNTTVAIIYVFCGEASKSLRFEDDSQARMSTAEVVTLAAIALGNGGYLAAFEPPPTEAFFRVS